MRVAGPAAALIYTAGRFPPPEGPPRVPSLRHLRKEAGVWQQPQPLDGRHQAALRAEPAADPDPAGRLADSGVRLHPLPQERPRHQSGLSAAVRLDGIHHVTCITGDAPRNVEFYTGVLGLRMVKKTVNQDDPTVYHLFYADERGSAGSDITFFEYPGTPRGRAGAGMVHRIAFRVGSKESLDFWQERVGGERDDASLVFEDPEGLA